MSERYNEYLKQVAAGRGDRSVSGDRYRDFNTVDVERSLDGDTVEGSKGRLAKSLRFAGIDAPESAQGFLGKAAQDFVDREIEAAGGKLRVGSAEGDGKGRQVSVVYAGKKNLNVELVRNGHAQVYERYLPRLSKAMRDELVEAQAEAQAAKRGIWAADSGYEDSETFRRRQEALYGRGAGARGHDRRERVHEGEVSTAAERYRRFLAATGRGRSGAPSLAGGNGSGRAAEDRGPPIYGEDRYAAEDGFFDHVMGGLDYLGNISRSAMRGVVQKGGSLEQGAEFALQAAKKRRKTSATALKDATTEGLGLGKLRAGKDDGEFQAGDVADVGADLVIDLVTDPVSWLTAGWSRMAKGAGAMGKGAAAAKRAEAGLLVGKRPAEMGKYLAAERGVRAGIGAAYGYGSSDRDASMLERAMATAAGAGLGYVSRDVGAAVGKRVRPWMDAQTNKYAVWTRGSRFKRFAQEREVALEAYDRKKNIAEAIRQGRLGALGDLKEAERLEVGRTMQELKTETIRFRNRYVKANGIKDHTPEFQEATRLANEYVTQNVLGRVLQNKRREIADAVVAWSKHNENVIAEFNKEVYGLKTPKAVAKSIPEGKGVVGLRYHIDDVFEKRDLKNAEDALDAVGSYLQRAKTEKRSGAMNVMGPDKSYAVYAEKMATKFLSEAEHKAMKLMSEYRETAAKQGFIRGSEAVLHGYDKLTNFIKANMLFFSVSWLKNNYWDNMAKAYVENGLHGLVDSATLGALQKGLVSDVRRLYAGDIRHARTGADFPDALRLGVLDNPMFKSMTDEFTRDFLYTPKEILKAAKDDRKLGSYIQKGADWLVDKNPVAQVMQRVGTLMEGTARYTTYQRTLGALRASPGMKGVKDETLKKIAAETVKKTFFDYSKVTAFENATLKRLLPFYSFYSKNVPYWLNATFDPNRAARVMMADRVRRNIGTEPTSEDKKGLDPFLLEGAPRKLGRDKRGDAVYAVMPSHSMHDALNLTDVRPTKLWEQVLDKGHSVPKMVYEVASGEDLFTGDKLLASESKGGKKFLYSRGFKYLAVKKGLELLGENVNGVFKKAASELGVDVDAKGNPSTSKDWLVVLDRVGSTLFPHGAVDQLAGSWGKVSYSKETWGEAVRNRMLPITTIKVSPDYARMVRQRRAEKEGK